MYQAIMYKELLNLYGRKKIKIVKGCSVKKMIKDYEKKKKIKSKKVVPK